jgi:hypothetical protein
MARNAKAYAIEPLDFAASMPAGAYWIGRIEGKDHGIHFGCPCGCGVRSWLPFGPDGWSVEKPFPDATLSPSIGNFAGQKPFHWHGHLRNGVFEECE